MARVSPYCHRHPFTALLWPILRVGRRSVSLETGELHTSLVTTVGEQGPGKVLNALGMENRLRPKKGVQGTLCPLQGPQPQQGGLGASLCAHAIFKTGPRSLPQQNEIQLIQLKQFWEQLLKAFNVR